MACPHGCENADYCQPCCDARDAQWARDNPGRETAAQEELLVRFAIWQSGVWDADNKDDVSSARACVRAFMAGEESP